MSNQKKTKKILFTSHVASFQKFNRPFMRMMREDGWEVHYASMGEEEILDHRLQTAEKDYQSREL